MMTDTRETPRPVPRIVHAWAIVTVVATLFLLVLGQLVTSYQAGMADPVWPTTPWYLANNYNSDFQYLIEHTHRIMGFSVGGIVGILAVGLWASAPSNRWLGLGCVVALIAGFGEFHRAVMAQKEAQSVVVPMQSVAAMGAAVAVLATLATRDLMTGRGGLRLLGLLALIGVMIQGLLGGLRVRLNALVGTDLATVHGVFGQIVFCLMVAIAILTARRFQHPLPAATRRSLAGWSVALVSLAFVQLVWGAMVRHAPSPLSQRLHLLTAFAVIAAAVWLVRGVVLDPAARSRLFGAGVMLCGLLAVQVVLGVEAWMTKFGQYLLPEQVPLTNGYALTRTLHSLVGAGILATAVTIALRARYEVARADLPPGEAGDSFDGVGTDSPRLMRSGPAAVAVLHAGVS